MTWSRRSARAAFRVAETMIVIGGSLAAESRHVAL